MDIGKQIFEEKIRELNNDFYNLIKNFIEYIPYSERMISSNNKLYKNKKFYYSTLLDLEYYHNPLIANNFTFKALFHDIGHAIFFMHENPERLLLDNFNLIETDILNVYEEVNAIIISEHIFKLFQTLEVYNPTEKLRIFKNNKIDINEKYLNINIFDELERLSYVLQK